jgi:hypothetical protein
LSHRKRGGELKPKIQSLRIIAVGDVVRFKGGGSPMTVQTIEGEEAICTFSLGGWQRLRLEVLEKVPDQLYWWGRG